MNYQLPSHTLKMIEESNMNVVSFQTTPLKGDPIKIVGMWPKVINTTKTSAITLEGSSNHIFVDLPNTKAVDEMFIHISYLISKHRYTEAWETIAECLIKHKSTCTSFKKTTAGRADTYLRITETRGALSGDKTVNVYDLYITSERK